jgi:methionine-rich copper-binding protein CopC
MNRKWKIIIAIIAFLIFVVFIFINSPQKNPIQRSVTITSSVPANNATSVSVFNPVSITFNQPVDPSNITITSTPVETWSLTQESANTVQANHALYFKNATSYKLTVSIQEKIIGTIAFKTEQPQNDPRQLQQLQSDLNKDYPLASFTPYQTPNYRVVYSAPLTLEIDITGSISTQDAILQVKSWVSSNNVDPTTHKYNVVSKK